MSTRMRAVFLDFQDTLARFRDGAWNSAYGLYVEAAREHGIELAPDSVVLPSDEAWADYQTPEGPAHPDYSGDPEAFSQVRITVHRRRLAKAGITGDTAVAIGRRIDELEGDAARYVLFDDVIPALGRVRDGGAQVVIVSNHIWRLSDIVAELGLAPYVDHVINSARVGYRKPHPAIYRAALEASGVPAGETVMVGDSVGHDVRGAERAGLHGVYLDRSGTASPPADVRTITTLAEIPLEWT
ncbi:MAG: HAD-IIIA family hydrolase [Dehalococcoidia bacterium]|nr:HAD-IIIA family hydrolase [Dehalococcoidia bacterium]